MIVKLYVHEINQLIKCLPACISTMSMYISLSSQKFPGKLCYKQYCYLCYCWNKYVIPFILSETNFYHTVLYLPLEKIFFMQFENFLLSFFTQRLTVISIGGDGEPPFNIKKHVPKNLYDFFVIDSSKKVLPSSAQHYIFSSRE